MFPANLLSLWAVFLGVICGLFATWVILRFWEVTQVLRGLQLHLILESFLCDSESSPSSEFYLDTCHKEEQSCCRSAAQLLGNTFQRGLRNFHWHGLKWFSEAAWDTQCSVAAERDPWHPGSGAEQLAFVQIQLLLRAVQNNTREWPRNSSVRKMVASVLDFSPWLLHWAMWA